MTVTTAQARYQAELYRVTGTPVAASIVVSLCDQLDALTLAFETERDAANLYAKQVAHWIGKHDALLEQQLSAQPSQAGEPPRFPTMLCKMWSGSEVQDWINANWRGPTGATK